jgi:gluconokinase
VYLHGDHALLLRRLEQRENHFMKASLLDSQLAALEPPKEALTVDIRNPPAKLVEEIRHRFRV